MAKKSTADGEYRISLTGPNSHRLVLEPGVGSLSIGPGKAGLVVEPGVPIQWTALDQFATPAGSAWPRWLTYTGDDVGIFEWARKRAIEGLDWIPTRALEVDASAARIFNLTITLRGHALRMRMPEAVSSLSLGGDVALLEASGAMPESVTLAPKTSRRGDGAARLPDLGAFAGVTDLGIHNEPMHRPVSLLGLEKLGALESLALHGAIADLETVASLPKLASLALRFMPSLEGLPPLSALPGLDSIIVYNVDDQASRSMRQQLKDRARVRPWSGHASVSQPRKPEWFASEYGRPFSGWPGRRAKIANTAFDEAQATLAKARTAKAIEAAIVAFARTFNTMKGIETTEREDLADAVVQLIDGAKGARAAAVTEEMALGWFDGARDY